MVNLYVNPLWQSSCRDAPMPLATREGRISALNTRFKLSHFKVWVLGRRLRANVEGSPFSFFFSPSAFSVPSVSSATAAFALFRDGAAFDSAGLTSLPALGLVVDLVRLDLALLAGFFSGSSGFSGMSDFPTSSCLSHLAGLSGLVLFRGLGALSGFADELAGALLLSLLLSLLLPLPPLPFPLPLPRGLPRPRPRPWFSPSSFPFSSPSLSSAPWLLMRSWSRRRRTWEQWRCERLGIFRKIGREWFKQKL